jgi:hypothetical protein
MGFLVEVTISPDIRTVGVAYNKTGAARIRPDRVAISPRLRIPPPRHRRPSRPEDMTDEAVNARS